MSSRALVTALRRFACLYEGEPKQLAAELRSFAGILDALANLNLPFSERGRIMKEIMAGKTQADTDPF